MKKYLGLVIMLSATACTHADLTYLPDGRLGYEIQCNGKWESSADCMKKAGEMCGPGGYDIIGSDREGTSYLSAAANSSGGFLNGGTHMNRNMLVACKNAPVAPPQ